MIPAGKRHIEWNPIPRSEANVKPSNEIGALTEMEALLVMFKPDGERKDFKIQPGKRYIIGRKEECQLRIPLPSVSREHAAVYFDEEEDELMIEDLGSSNGTYVNREKTKGATELTPGDVVQIGEVPFQVVIDGHPAEIEPIAIAEPGGGGERTSKREGDEDEKATATTSTGKGESGAGAESDDQDSDSDSNVDSFFGFDLDEEDI